MKRIAVIMVLALGLVAVAKFAPITHHGQAFAQDEGSGGDDGGDGGGSDDGGGD